MNQRRIRIVRYRGDAVAAETPVQRALEEMEASLSRHGIDINLTDTDAALTEGGYAAPDHGPFVIVASSSSEPARAFLRAAGVAFPEEPEATGLVPGEIGGRPALLACGSDARGLAYAVLELADRARGASDPGAVLDAVLDVPAPVVERPANRIRSIARLFTSEVEDTGWFHDRDFWRQYLAMLVGQRYNRFSLTLGLGYDFPRNIRDACFYFAYPFLLTVPGYDVRAANLPDSERDRNLESLRFLSGEAAERGLHFQLGLWTHAAEWIDSPNASHPIEGLTSSNHAAYCRDALRALLEACPAIAGVTFRIHGESGVPERSYDFWRTLFDGIAGCGRRVEIDMHAKGIDREMIDIALATGMPVTVSPKFWAEHMGLPYHQASIREMERPPEGGSSDEFMALSSGSRSFLRYGYGDLMAENRRHGVLHRAWPGTQRLLLWGDPVMAAGYGRCAGFCGGDGMEFCEPLSFKGRKGSGLPGGRNGYADPSMKADGGDWRKYLIAYRLLGRLLYNPDTDPEVLRRPLREEFGAAAEAIETALANASRILPLVTVAHHPSASNNAYWPEIYTNIPIVDEARPHPYGDTPKPRRLGAVSPLDPELFASVDGFADEVMRGRRSGRYSPLDVARWLDRFSEASSRALDAAKSQIDNPDAPSFRRFAVDAAILAGLGRFFAGKLRAGVRYALHERTGDAGFLEEALAEARVARDAWAGLSSGAADAYVGDLTFGPSPHQRGHWRDRLTAIDDDISDMARLLEGCREADTSSSAPSVDPARIEQIRSCLADFAGRPGAPWICHDAAPPVFRRGESIPVELSVRTNPGPDAAWLRYRRVNQAERWQAVEMERVGDRFRATIPESVTDTEHPIQYFIVVEDDGGRAWPYPGFNETLSNQPYRVIRLFR